VTELASKTAFLLIARVLQGHRLTRVDIFPPARSWSPPSSSKQFIVTRDRTHPEREEVLRRGCEISRNDQVGSEFTKQLGTRRRRAQKTPLVPPVQAGFYFADGRSPLGVAQPIPNDFNHLHFGAGQTEAEITLKPGTHTLQLLLGDKDHIPHNPPVMSPRIRVVVTEEGTAPREAASQAPTRRTQNTRKRYRYSRRSRSY
jgi:Domain of unknown function (DUF4399)